MIITNAPLVNHQTEYESEWVRAMDFRASLRGPQHKYDASVVNIELLHCTFFRNLINKGFPVIELRDGFLQVSA
jgi:hypothetical protein